MTKKFAIVLALFLVSIVCCAGCIGPGEEPVDPVDPITPVDPVDPVVPVEEYSVMFMLNYGDAGAYSAETVKAGETVSKPANPTRSGYTFKGWFTAAESGVEYDFSQAVNADVTLYAQWKKKSSSSSSSSSSGSTNSNAHLEGTTVTPSLGNAVTGEGSSTSVTGTVTTETGGNKVVTVTDSSGVKMEVTYESGATESNDGKTVTGEVSSVAVTYPEKDAGTASADSPAASASLELELTKAVDTLPTIDSDFKQEVSEKIESENPGAKPLAMITASNADQVNLGIKTGGLTITFKLTGLSDEDRSKLVGYHVSSTGVDTVPPASISKDGETTTVVLKGDSFSSWAVGIAKECQHNDLTLTHDDETTFDGATHSGSCKDCDYTVTNEDCDFTETTQDGGSTLYKCSKCGYQYSKAGSDMNLESVTIVDGKITSAAQLFKLAELVNAGQFTGAVTLDLDVDIDLADVAWTPIGTSTNSFSGTFDGQGHTITGLTNKADATSFGLFEKVYGTVVIKNFDLYVNAVTDNSESEGWAGVVGMSNGAQCDLTLENIKVYGTLTAADKVAGLIAQAPTYGGNGSKLKVKDCENHAAVTGTRAAGICCAINTDSGNTFENCVNYGKITAMTGKYQTAAGILCKNEAGTVFTNCKNEGVLDATIAYNIATKLVIQFTQSDYRYNDVEGDEYYYTQSNPNVEAMYNLFVGGPYSADTAVDWEQVVRTSYQGDQIGLGAGVWYGADNMYNVTVTAKQTTYQYTVLKKFENLGDALGHPIGGDTVTLMSDQTMTKALSTFKEDWTVGEHVGLFSTMNLNGHTLTMCKNISVNSDGGGPTIKDGTIVHNADGWLFYITGTGDGGVVTFDNVTLNAEEKCIAKIGATYTATIVTKGTSSINGYVDLGTNPNTKLRYGEETFTKENGQYVVFSNNVAEQKSSLTSESQE